MLPFDGKCQDGGPNSINITWALDNDVNIAEVDACDYGTDCADCANVQEGDRKGEGRIMPSPPPPLPPPPADTGEVPERYGDSAITLADLYYWVNQAYGNISFWEKQFTVTPRQRVDEITDRCEGVENAILMFQSLDDSDAVCNPCDYLSPPPSSPPPPVPPPPMPPGGVPVNMVSFNLARADVLRRLSEGGMVLNIQHGVANITKVRADQVRVEEMTNAYKVEITTTNASEVDVVHAIVASDGFKVGMQAAVGVAFNVEELKNSIVIVTPPSPPAAPPPPHIVIIINITEFGPAPDDPESHYDLWASRRYTLQFSGNHPMVPGDRVWLMPSTADEDCKGTNPGENNDENNDKGGPLSDALQVTVYRPAGDYVLCMKQDTKVEHSHVTFTFHDYSPPPSPYYRRLQQAGGFNEAVDSGRAEGAGHSRAGDDAQASLPGPHRADQHGILRRLSESSVELINAENPSPSVLSFSVHLESERGSWYHISLTPGKSIVYASLELLGVRLDTITSLGSSRISHGLYAPESPGGLTRPRIHYVRGMDADGESCFSGLGTRSSGEHFLVATMNIYQPCHTSSPFNCCDRAEVYVWLPRTMRPEMDPLYIRSGSYFASADGEKTPTYVAGVDIPAVNRVTGAQPPPPPASPPPVSYTDPPSPPSPATGSCPSAFHISELLEGDEKMAVGNGIVRSLLPDVMLLAATNHDDCHPPSPPSPLPSFTPPPLPPTPPSDPQDEGSGDLPYWATVLLIAVGSVVGAAACALAVALWVCRRPKEVDADRDGSIKVSLLGGTLPPLPPMAPSNQVPAQRRRQLH